VACGIATGNTLEVFLAVFALQRIGFSSAVERLSDVVKLVVVGAVLATAVSATCGVASLYLGHVIVVGHLATTWRAWWVGDAIGALVVAPLLLTWSHPQAGAPSKSLVEAAALAAALLVASLCIFGRTVPAALAFQEPYLLFPVLLWSAARFGPRGAATATFAASFVAITMTALHSGPFVHATLSESLLFLQVFIAFIAVTFLALGALASELTIRRRELQAVLDSMRAAREQAERTSQLKSRLLRTVSHELRTPLATLWLQLERMRIQEDSSLQDGTDLLSRMATQMERLRQLIEGLLRYARAESGRLTLEIERFDLAKLGAECVDELRASAHAKGLAIQLAGPVEQHECESDPRLLQVVLTNLLGNAIKFTSEGSVTLKIDRSDEHHIIAVEDTGPGVPPADQGRMFEPFEQLDHLHPKRISGAGLGLALVRELTIALGGSIRIDSVLGRGCTFTLLLPASDAKDATNQSPISAYASRGAPLP
jgi:signal transduction histidine kinase